MNKMPDVNYQKIARCIADEILPIRKSLINEREKLYLALEILFDNDLIYEYQRSRRRQIINRILLEERE